MSCHLICSHPFIFQPPFLFRADDSSWPCESADFLSGTDTTHIYIQQLYEKCDNASPVWHVKKRSCIVAFSKPAPKGKRKEISESCLNFPLFTPASPSMTLTADKLGAWKHRWKGLDFSHKATLRTFFLLSQHKSSSFSHFYCLFDFELKSLLNHHSGFPVYMVLIYCFNIKPKNLFPLSSAKQNKLRNPSAVTGLAREGHYLSPSL